MKYKLKLMKYKLDKRLEIIINLIDVINLLNKNLFINLN